jgi:hypothetical protein
MLPLIFYHKEISIINLKFLSMRKLLFVIVLVVIAGYVSANEFAKLLGTWDYKVEYAPQGYEKGQLIFVEKEGKVVGEVKIQGYSIPVRNLQVTEGQFKFGVTIENENIPVLLKVDGNKLTGKANTPDGDMPLSAVKAKPVQK